MRNAYDSTKDDLEQCLASASHVDSAEAKQVLEAVESTMAGQGGDSGSGPLQEIAGAIKNAMEQAVGPGKGMQESIVPVANQENIAAQSGNEPDALTEDFRKLMSKLSRGGNGEAVTSSTAAQKP